MTFQWKFDVIIEFLGVSGNYLIYTLYRFNSFFVSINIVSFSLLKLNEHPYINISLHHDVLY